MNFKGIVSLLLVVLLASCTVTLRKQDITSLPKKDAIVTAPVTDKAEGIVYALPKTGLRFIITAQKIEKKRGDFYQYSERYLGLKDVIMQDAVEWKINDVQLEVFGQANPKEMFQMVSDKSVMPLVQLSEDGVLLSINSYQPQEEKTLTSTPITPVADTDVPYTEEMLLANSSTKMAQEAASYIYHLRESRTNLLCSDLDALPPDGKAYAMSLEEINKLESQFLSLFKGNEIITDVTETIEVIPDDVKEKDVLFRFSTFNGVVAANDLSGSPFFITMEKEELSSLGSAPCDSAGLFYKKPAPVMIKIFDGATEILSENVLMGQFGELQTLPLGVVNEDVKILFYPATGAIKSVLK